MEDQIVWVILLIILGITGAFYFLFPRIMRRGLLFGYYVGEAISTGEEAKQITRSWYRGMTLWLLLSLAIVIGTRFYSHSPVAPAVGIAVFVLGFLIEYLRAYFRASHLSMRGAPPVAAAVLSAEKPSRLLLPYVAIGLGLIGGVGVVLYAWSHYGQLPNMVPKHFGISGTPDSWKPKSFFTVMLLPVMALIMGAGLGGIALLTAHAKRAIRAGDSGVSYEAQQRFRKVMANFLAIVSLLITAMMMTLSIGSLRVAMKEVQTLSPLLDLIGIALVVLAFGGSLFIAIKYGQGGSRLERHVADAPLTDGLADNRFWILGTFYLNRDDPSLFVEHRFGLGYTINFGNPKALALVIGFFGLILIVVVLAALTH